MVLKKVMWRSTDPKTRPAVCASLRKRDAHGHVTRTRFNAEICDTRPQTRS